MENLFFLLKYLNQDVLRLIRMHICAIKIQETFLRWRYWKHVHNPYWKDVRDHLGINNVLFLWPYEDIRREWRYDLTSWLNITEKDLCWIKAEAKYEGLWGSKTDKIN